MHFLHITTRGSLECDPQSAASHKFLQHKFAYKAAHTRYIARRERETGSPRNIYRVVVYIYTTIGVHITAMSGNEEHLLLGIAILKMQLCSLSLSLGIL